jgi:hypothetical protein
MSPMGLTGAGVPVVTGCAYARGASSPTTAVVKIITRRMFFLLSYVLSEKCSSIADGRNPYSEYLDDKTNISFGFNIASSNDRWLVLEVLRNFGSSRRPVFGFVDRI